MSAQPNVTKISQSKKKHKKNTPSISRTTRKCILCDLQMLILRQNRLALVTSILGPAGFFNSPLVHLAQEQSIFVVLVTSQCCFCNKTDFSIGDSQVVFSNSGA